MRCSFERTVFAAAVAGILLLSGGCCTLPETGPDVVPPMRTYEEVEKSGIAHMLDVTDSVEGFNRGAYRFNYYFDEYFFLPVVHTYEFILPDYVEDRISSAIDNIGEFGNLTNNLLQLKFKAAGITLSRFVINSTIGIGGLWDPAGAMGLEPRIEDFGQTLGYYGVGKGSYLVLPILGPSNVRDTAGMAVDATASSFAGPIAWIDSTAASAAYSGTYAVDRRHRIPFRYRQSGSPFEYELLRMLSTMKRDMEAAE